MQSYLTSDFKKISQELNVPLLLIVIDPLVLREPFLLSNPYHQQPSLLVINSSKKAARLRKYNFLNIFIFVKLYIYDFILKYYNALFF